MKVAPKGNYWVRVNNLTKKKTHLTSYDGFTTLKEAKVVRDEWATATLPKIVGDDIITVSVEDRDGNIVYPKIF